MPTTEDALFILEKFPLLDTQLALQTLGQNHSLLHDILQELLIELPLNQYELETLNTQGDWAAIENLAHKMKGGAAYCGTIKLKIACQYLERYIKSNQHTQRQALLAQLLCVLQKTQNAIEQWINGVD